MLSGHKVPCWGEESLLQLACGIEGHPDNVAPAIYGGVQIGIHTGERWRSERVTTPPGLQVHHVRTPFTTEIDFCCCAQAVVFIPDDIGTTSKARAILKVCHF